MTLEKITSEALKLDKKERLKLIKAILDSMAIDESEVEDTGLTKDQLKELDRRLDLLYSGKIKAIPGDIAVAEIAKKYGLQN